MKKLVTLLLAMVMIFSLATTAFAAGTNTITVKGTVENETYKIYKLFDLSVNEEMTAYTYTVNEKWEEFFTTGAGKDYVIIDDQGYVTIENEAAAANLAKVAAAALAGKTEAGSIEATGESVTFTGLDNGYYLITSTLGTLAMTDTTPTNPNPEVNEKNKEDTIVKEVKEDSTKEYGEKNDAQVGDLVEFKSTITLVKNTRNVTVHDKMDSGLTYTVGSAAIEDLTKGTDYTLVETPDDGDTFDIVFSQTYLDSLTAPETVLTLTYTATLNENAVVKDENGVAIVDQNNETKITYGDKQSVEDQTTTTTHKFVVNKFAAGVEDLADAVFSLKKADAVVKLIQIDDNNYRVAKEGEEGVTEFTTVASGDIVIWGVDADDDYTLEEITAPAGYNKLPAEVEVTVDADNSTQVDVENKAGTELPSTGGVGTTMFYVIGGLMMLMAVVLLVTKKRMASAE